ncbi:MAG: ATP phosphoribosyltransferase regulatory subunit, partial [Pirellula sp.]
LSDANITESQIQHIFSFESIRGDAQSVLKQLSGQLAGNELAQSGIDRLNTIRGALQAAGVSADHFEIDVSIARGLDYYTGVVFETTLGDLPEIGSVCSGGRYDNLAELFTKQHLPGIGASLGLDRLLSALEKLGRIPSNPSAADVFIPLFDADRINDYFALAALVRQSGLSAEVYPEPKKLGAQLKYADQRGFKVALVAGSRELDEGIVQIKDLRNKTSADSPWRNDPNAFIDAVKLVLSMNRGDLLADDS